MSDDVNVNEPFLYKLGSYVPRDVVYLTVHPSVKILPYSAFSSLTSLKEVQLSSVGLEEIGMGAFARCVSLERIYCCPSTTESSEERINDNNNDNNNNTFPSTLVKIGFHAFAHCNSLKEMLLPEGLRKICRYAFANCTSLERIDCPSALVTIGGEAFGNCTSLTEMTLSVGGITIIGGGAFRNCSSLKGITIATKKAFAIDVDTVDTYQTFNCRLVSRNTINGTNTRKMIIISPERLNNTTSPPHPLEVENTISTLLVNNGHNGHSCTEEENSELQQALIAFHAFVEGLTILELALWKNEMQGIDDLMNPGVRGRCRALCGADIIIPRVLPYL